MKSEVLNPENKKRLIRTAPKMTVEEVDTFEKDWANAISSDEFWKRVHQHIEKLYATPPKK